MNTAKTLDNLPKVAKIAHSIHPQAKDCEVRYQRLAGSWFAFSEVDGEVYYAKIPDSQILDAIKK